MERPVRPPKHGDLVFFVSDRNFKRGPCICRADSDMDEYGNLRVAVIEGKGRKERVVATEWINLREVGGGFMSKRADVVTWRVP